MERKQQGDLPWLESSNHITQPLQVAEDLKRKKKRKAQMATLENTKWFLQTQAIPTALSAPPVHPQILNPVTKVGPCSIMNTVPKDLRL